LEEEHEQRKLEQIYQVAGEDKKTHVSMVELYGFFSWNLSAIAFILYMIWAFVPDDVLRMFGIHFIPNKYYAIAFPLWIAVTMFTVLELYVCICMMATPSLESYETLQDKHTILKEPNFDRQLPDI
jgi:phosphatidylinositol glycan class P protein